MKIKLKDNHNIFALNSQKVYDVLCIEENDYRIINNMGDPVLYEISIFELYDTCVPHNWVIEIDSSINTDNTIIYLGPEIFNAQYFFEDFFDGDIIIQNMFLKYINSNKIIYSCNLLPSLFEEEKAV